MTRSYNERRNRQIFVLIDRRKTPPKDVPAIMLALGFKEHLTYSNVRKILERIKKCHKMSQNVTPPARENPLP